INLYHEEDSMTRYEQKREHERFDLDASMIYAFHDSDLFFQARMCNYCKGGMCFLSGDALEPGSDIYIMMENFAPDAVGAEFYDGYLAEVRWCRKMIRDRVEQFKIGVKYYQTIIK
ncbi:MAG: PilZ domain-containing protein, partial [Terriglobia bacterium]